MYQKLRALYYKLNAFYYSVIGLFINNNDKPFRVEGKNKFVFIHINKTGGTSISKSLGLKNIKHYTVKSVIKEIGEEKFNEAFKFCVVRNPWERAVSQYKYRVQTNQNSLKLNRLDFNEWVKKSYGPEIDPFYHNSINMFQNQLDWIKDEKGRIRVDKIIRFENLNEGFEEVSKVLSLKNELPHLKSTQKDNYRDYYNEESKEIISNWFKDDIEYFNYSF